MLTRRRISLFLLLMIGLAAGLSLMVREAEAQQARPRTLMQWLFGEKPRPMAEPQQQRKQPKKKRRTSSITTIKTAPVVEKLADARRILVIGDFLGAGLGEGLKVAFEATADVVVEPRAMVSSGLTRDDHFNWVEMLPAYLEEVKPVAVVIQLGANDQQAMPLPAGKEKYRSEAWIAAYEARVGQLVGIARARNLPVYWVGLPAFGSSDLTAGAVQLNAIYRKEAEKAGGEFIDIWDGFVDENGKFVVTGSDINGQQVRLRSSDGINMTRAGRRTMAFYAEKSLRKLIGGDTAPTLEPLDKDALIGTAAAEKKIEDVVSTPPISITDPELDGGSELLGGASVARLKGRTARDVLTGVAPWRAPPEGRLDDYVASPASVTR